jgi:hypothetical protein
VLRRSLVLCASLAAVAVPALAASPAHAAPTKVYVGVFINDLQDVNLENGTYFVDFYMWMKWNGSKKVNPAENIDIINSFDSWGTVVRPLAVNQKTLSDGSQYRISHFQGRYNTVLPLQKYPFSVENLRVVLEDAEDSSTKLVYVPDPPRPITQSPNLAAPGYETGTATLKITNQAYPTNFGLTGTGNEPYSRITITVPVSRPWFPYAVKYLLPLLVVLIAAAMVFLIPPRFVEGRFGLAITALLTVIALKWTTDAELPNVDYLTLLDVLYVISLLFVITTIGVATYSAWQLNHGREESEIVSIDRWALVGGGLLTLLAVAATLLVYLT